MDIVRAEALCAARIADHLMSKVIEEKPLSIMIGRVLTLGIECTCSNLGLIEVSTAQGDTEYTLQSLPPSSAFEMIQHIDFCSVRECTFPGRLIVSMRLWTILCTLHIDDQRQWMHGLDCCMVCGGDYCDFNWHDDRCLVFLKEGKDTVFRIM